MGPDGWSTSLEATTWLLSSTSRGWENGTYGFLSIQSTSSTSSRWGSGLLCIRPLGLGGWSTGLLSSTSCGWENGTYGFRSIRSTSSIIRISKSEFPSIRSTSAPSKMGRGSSSASSISSTTKSSLMIRWVITVLRGMLLSTSIDVENGT